jgi:hypothetical protein
MMYQFCHISLHLGSLLIVSGCVSPRFEDPALGMKVQVWNASVVWCLCQVRGQDDRKQLKHNICEAQQREACLCTEQHYFIDLLTDLYSILARS